WCAPSLLHVALPICEDGAKPSPLMSLEAVQPFGKGEGVTPAAPATKKQSGKNPRGMQAERVAPDRHVVGIIILLLLLLLLLLLRSEEHTSELQSREK